MAESLTPKHQRYVDRYLVDLNQTQAYMDVYGVSEDVARSNASRLMKKPGIADAIEAAVEARAKRTQITADAVLSHWATVATADPNELIEYRRTCCRYCHGTDFGYQRTKRELENDRAVWEDRQKRLAADALKAGKEAPPEVVFDEQGGTGYDRRKSPHPECPDCFGEGIGTTFPKDTRTLTAAGRVLYAGVKQTSNGLEVLMRNQDEAMANVAKHLGMFVQKVDVTVNGSLAVRLQKARERAAT